LKIENIDRTESYDFPSHMLMKIKDSFVRSLAYVLADRGLEGHFQKYGFFYVKH